MEQSERPWWTPDQMLKDGAWPFGRQALYRGLKEGVIPCRRIGKRFMIPKAAYHRWLEPAGQGEGLPVTPARTWYGKH